MEDRFRTVRFLVIGDTEEEAQAALGLLEENLPVVAFTPPELAKDGKYVAQAGTQVLIEEVEKFRELNRLEKLKRKEDWEARFPGVRFLVIGDTEEEAQAALGLLNENLPVFVFSAPELAENGKYVAQAETEVLIEEVERFRELNRLEELKKSEA